MNDRHHNIRNTKPLKIDLTPEQALRRAMQVPAPASDPKSPPKKSRPKKKTKRK